MRPKHTCYVEGYHHQGGHRYFMHLLPLEKCLRLCDILKVCFHGYLTNHFWEFTILLQLRTMMNWFWCQKIKDLGETTWSNEHFGWHFLTYIWNAWSYMYFSKTYLSYSLPVHLTPMTFSRSCIKKLRSQTTFFKNAFFRQRHADWWFAIEYHLVSHMATNGLATIGSPVADCCSCTAWNFNSHWLVLIMVICNKKKITKWTQIPRDFTFGAQIHRRLS